MSDFGGPSSSRGLPHHEEGEESRQPPLKLLRRTAEGEGTSGEMASSLRPRQPKRPRAKTKQRQRHKNLPPSAATPSHSPPISDTDLPSSLLLPRPVPPPIHITASPFSNQLNRSHQMTFTPQNHPSPIVINLCTPSPSPPERDNVAMAASVPVATTSSTQGFDIHSILTNPGMSQSEPTITSGNSSQVPFPSPTPLRQQRGLNAHTIVSVPLSSVRRIPRPTHPYSLRQRSVPRPASAAMATRLHGSGHPYATDLNPSQAGMRLRHYGTINPFTALGALNPLIVPTERTFHSVVSSPPSRSHSSNTGSTPNPTTSISTQLQTSANPSSVSAPYCFSLPIRPTHASSNAPTPAMNIFPPSHTSNAPTSAINVFPPSPSISDPLTGPFSQVPALASARTVGIGSPIASSSQLGSAGITGFPTPQTDLSSSSRVNPLHPTLGMNPSPLSLAVSAATRHPTAPSRQLAEQMAHGMVQNYWSNMAAQLDQNTAFIAAHSRSSRNGTGTSDIRQLRPGLGSRVARPATVRTGHASQVPNTVTAIRTMSGNVIPVSRWSGQLPAAGASEPPTVRVFSSAEVPHMSSMAGTNSLTDLSFRMVPADSRYTAESDSGTSSLPVHTSSSPIRGDPGLNPGFSHLHVPRATVGPPSSRYQDLMLPSIPTDSQDGAETSTRLSGGGSSGLSSRDSPNRAGSSARTFRYRRCGGASTSAASGGPSRRLESEVINVDDIDSDDSDDDVILGSVEMGDERRRRQQQISRDLAYARDLQAQFDREASVIPQLPPPSGIISHPLSAHAAIPRGNLPSHMVPTAAVPPQPEADHAFPWVPIEEDVFPSSCVKALCHSHILEMGLELNCSVLAHVAT